MIKNLIVCIIMCIPNLVYAVAFSERPEVKEFIEQLAQEIQIDPKSILSSLSQIESSQEIIDRMNTPSEALPWDKYQKLFINQQRINGGTKFWREYAALLQQAESQYGVPAEIIVAIIGVESSYGKNPGKYPVLQALATLAFDYPRRADFFKNELKEYLLLTQEQKLDPLELKGSYAGAIGTPQFLASSYRNFAVDFDKSGKIDLIHNAAHAIGSIANYFKQNGWQSGQPVVYKAVTKGQKFKALPIAVASNPKPALSLATLQQHGINPKGKINNPTSELALLEFQNGDKKEYWLGLENFYVITRYNHSSNYAMAVYQLSLAISKLYKNA